MAGGLAARLAKEASPAPRVDGGSPAFVHLSGALKLTALKPLSDQGYAVGAFHPLQSFPRERPPSAFEGSVIAIDATTPELRLELEHLAEHALHARPKRVTDDQRLLYHAAAVMASNYLIALAGQSAALLGAIGWPRDEAIQALVPLMRGALQSLEQDGLPNALIGPIRRGDARTVQAQLDALANAEATPGSAAAELPAAVYRILGLAALELAREAGLDQAEANRIKEALTG